MQQHLSTLCSLSTLRCQAWGSDTDKNCLWDCVIPSASSKSHPLPPSAMPLHFLQLLWGILQLLRSPKISLGCNRNLPVWWMTL